MKNKLLALVTVALLSAASIYAQNAGAHRRSTPAKTTAKTTSVATQKKDVSVMATLPVTPITFNHTLAFDFEQNRQCPCGMGLCPFVHSGVLSFLDVKAGTYLQKSLMKTNDKTCPGFSEGTMLIVMDNGRFLFVDSSLKQISRSFDGATTFQDGIAVVHVVDPSGPDLGNMLLDHQNHLLPVEPYFKSIGKAPPMFLINGAAGTGKNPFQEGLAAISFSESRGSVLEYGFLNTQNKLVFTAPANTRQLNSFSNGMAWFKASAVGQEDRWGAFDSQFQVAIPPTFSHEPAPFSDGMAAVQDRAGYWGFIDRSGQLLVPAIYAEIVSPFNDGVAIVRVDRDLEPGERMNSHSIFWVIDKKGKVLKKFDSLNGIFCNRKDNLCLLMEDSGDGVMDRKGNVLLYSPGLRGIGEFGDGLDGLAWASFEPQNGPRTPGLIDIHGNFHLAWQQSKF